VAAVIDYYLGYQLNRPAYLHLCCQKQGRMRMIGKRRTAPKVPNTLATIGLSMLLHVLLLL
jgi:hypothetical protein